MKITDYSLEEFTRGYGTVDKENNTVHVTHNAGFFSCCTIRLLMPLIYFNTFRKWPKVESSGQFIFFKDIADVDITMLLFNYNTTFPAITEPMLFTSYEGEPSNSDYAKDLNPKLRELVNIYFSLSELVSNRIQELQKKYSIDLDNTCAVFYRGNDKLRETPRIPYSDYIDKAMEIKQGNPGIKFYILPDETEFLELFKKVFPEDTIIMDETLHMRRKDSAIMYELPAGKKEQHALDFLCQVYIASQCSHLINHTGNGAMWAYLFRGHTNGHYQWREGQWL